MHSASTLRIEPDVLEKLAREDARVIRALGDKTIARAIVRAPKVVSFSAN